MKNQPNHKGKIKTAKLTNLVVYIHTNTRITDDFSMRRPTIGYTVVFASLATLLMMSVYFNQHSYQAAAFPKQYQGGSQIFGVISSMQNDESGQPGWIVSGRWTSTLGGNNTVNASQATSNETSPFAGSPFDMQIEMVRFNGSASHTHSITDFVLANVSQPDNMTKAFNGTSTASMREGPVTDIPTTIKIMGDKVISIWLDPSRVDNHYGNTPIYGLVIDADRPRPGIVGNNSPLVR
jgi:hypothetical protein